MTTCGQYVNFLLLLVAVVSGQKTHLQVNPTTVTLGGDAETPRLTVTCTVSDSTITTITLIEVGKEVNGSKTKIALVTQGDDKPAIIDTLLRNKLTISGSIRKNSNQGDVVLHLSSLQCEDGGTYYCSSSYNDYGPKQEEIKAFIKVKANPESLQLSPLPDVSEYPIGTRADIKCSGNVGNILDTSKPSDVFTWETKLPTEDTWTPYVATNNIYYNVPVLNDNNRCQYRWSSILSHIVLDQDDKRQFRCSVYNGMSAQYTLHTETSTNLKFYIGLAVGIAVLVVIVVVVIVCFFRKYHLTVERRRYRLCC